MLSVASTILCSCGEVFAEIKCAFLVYVFQNKKRAAGGREVRLMRSVVVKFVFLNGGWSCLLLYPFGLIRHHYARVAGGESAVRVDCELSRGL